MVDTGLELSILTPRFKFLLLCSYASPWKSQECRGHLFPDGIFFFPSLPLHHWEEQKKWKQPKTKERIMFSFSLWNLQKISGHNSGHGQCILGSISLCLQRVFQTTLQDVSPWGQVLLCEIHLLVHCSKRLHFQQDLTKTGGHRGAHTHTHTFEPVDMPTKTPRCAYAYVFTNKQYIIPFSTMVSKIRLMC